MHLLQLYHLAAKLIINLSFHVGDFAYNMASVSIHSFLKLIEQNSMVKAGSDFISLLIKS